jgi:DNA-binding MarR family transcriptional regulator
VSEDARRLGDPGTPAFQIEKYPFYLLNRVVSRYNAIIDQKLRAITIDIPTWRVLMVLGESSPRSIGQISEAAVINLSTMMRIIQRMRAAGLVRCASRPDDRRVTEAFLTPLGARKLEAARGITSPVYEQIIRGLSEKQFLEIIGHLNHIYSNLTSIDDIDP